MLIILRSFSIFITVLYPEDLHVSQLTFQKSCLHCIKLSYSSLYYSFTSRPLHTMILFFHTYPPSVNFWCPSKLTDFTAEVRLLMILYSENSDTSHLSTVNLFTELSVRFLKSKLRITTRWCRTKTRPLGFSFTRTLFIRSTQIILRYSHFSNL